MFKNIARTLKNIARAISTSFQPALNHSIAPKPSKAQQRQYDIATGGRGKASGAAQLKRAAKKRNNIKARSSK